MDLLPFGLIQKIENESINNRNQPTKKNINMKKKMILFLGMIYSIHASSQKKLDVSINDLSEEFLKDVNKVVVSRHERNDILSQTTTKQFFSEINFIKNENGLDDLDLSVVYDKLSKLKHLEFKIYNAQGQLVKTFKEKDFKDTSLADGYSILTDNRMKYLNPSHFQYPFFSKFDYEIEQENTIFISPFRPITSSNDRIMEATYQLTYPQSFTINRNEKNFDSFKIETSETPNAITYKVKNLKAPEWEDFNVRYFDLIPYARFSNTTFGLGEVKGTAHTWKEFGVWYYEHFLKGLNKLPESTISKMKDLTRNASNDIEKAKIIFEYVQNNTRYISIQVGLGGWRPFPANEVDKLGYGDCKALTNYTKSLLEAVGVTSYYTIIHASNNVIDIDEKSIGLQGNHVILTLPTKEGNLFLECTSQRIPFGFIGTSTLNRKALAIKPGGAEFVTTYPYNENQNVLKGAFTVDLSNIQKVKSRIHFENQGVFYYDIFSLNKSDKEEIDLYVKNLFSKIKGLTVLNYQSTNDKEAYVIKEDINVESSFIGSKIGNDYMIAVNSFLPLSSLPKKYKNRKTNFAISRGKTYQLKTEYILPKDMVYTFVPESKNIESDFGKHLVKFEHSDGKLIVEETFVLKSGTYSKEKYDDYVQFILDVTQSSNSKIILTKN